MVLLEAQADTCSRVGGFDYRCHRNSYTELNKRVTHTYSGGMLTHAVVGGDTDHGSKIHYMKLFSFFTKKNKPNTFLDPIPDSVDKFEWTGSDFYLLITGATQIEKGSYDTLMTPKTFEWSRISQIKWPIYRVGEDEYSFSFEKNGIEITFCESVRFNKAKQIGDEIVEKLCSTGQIVNLYVMAKPKIYLNKA